MNNNNIGEAEKHGEYLFRLALSGIVAFLAVVLIIHNVFISPPIGSEFVFGLEFLTASYYMSQRKFKSFKE